MKIAANAILFALVLSCSVFAQVRKGEPAAKPPVNSATTVAAPAEQPLAPTHQAELSLFGTLGVAYAEGTYVLTCGGPKFGIKYGDFGFYAGLFPSLVYSEAYRNNSSAATPVRPNLGAGFEIGFQKISSITPVYYLPRDAYYYTIGIAYKFS